jgi:hypothetical protein
MVREVRPDESCVRGLGVLDLLRDVGLVLGLLSMKQLIGIICILALAGTVVAAIAVGHDLTPAPPCPVPCEPAAGNPFMAGLVLGAILGAVAWFVCERWMDRP